MLVRLNLIKGTLLAINQFTPMFQQVPPRHPGLAHNLTIVQPLRSHWRTYVYNMYITRKLGAWTPC